MRLQRAYSLLSVLALCLILSGCAGKKQPVAAPYTGPVCQDVLSFPQDLTVYAVTSGSERMLASASEQSLAADRQRQRHFRPWSLNKASLWVKQSLDKNFNMKLDKAFIGKGQPFPRDAWLDMETNSNKSAYPSGEGPAITLRHTNLRAMPTSMPYYIKPELPGEGYPFDYFQHTSLPMGAPLYICHTSRDGQWLLVESSITAGWLPAEDVASVDPDFMGRWQSRPLAALVRDNVNIAGRNAHIGLLLPLAEDAPRGRGQTLRVYYPEKEPSGAVMMQSITLPPDAAAVVPLPLTPGEVAKVGNEMMGQAYGWGGLDEKRDCSALTRDLFTPFGIFLPRNSASQAKVGRSVYLAGLSQEEKEEDIRREALPFSSLIWMPGHIGVYVGEYNGKTVMFHNMWGLRTRDADGGCDGRAVVGKAVVTSLRPGIERPDLCVSGSFLERIERAAILPGLGEVEEGM